MSRVLPPDWAVGNPKDGRVHPGKSMCGSALSVKSGYITIWLVVWIILFFRYIGKNHPN